MPGIVVIAQLTTAGGEARQSVIDALSKVSAFSRDHEPGVVRYAIAVPRDATDEAAVWVVEEYTSQAAFDQHMGSKPVTDLIAYFTANPALFAGETKVAMTEPSSTFTRPEISNTEDPHFVYAAIDYKEGERDEALEGWKTVTSETQKNEPETLSYSILKDKGNSVTINTLEVYASEAYFKQVHVPSNAVKENRQKYGDEIRTSMKWAILKKVAGYLYKEKPSSNL
ncbi:hypothetical protein BU24DRAFT_417993 [Aaosphaeria arxii CBS 175.79]|uniref:ABM domain-containing protein n=1 Tax=Aaosphaeria arxii CBS 175.79 TaxID=1450172 RepID=A0A6A5YCK0_9PLEO|nr:uncharacterized protein BU24DRAFT_417993 [Aaosphaeria arxii CBS 175.79]KAF2022344.1 hypothetical protein BU24DRAFT_417993 [Aaosphaeria arxii CBS 175.79]